MGFGSCGLLLGNERWFPAKDGNEDNMLIFCVVSWPVSLLMMVGILVWDRIKKPGGGDDDCE